MQDRADGEWAGLVIIALVIGGIWWWSRDSEESPNTASAYASNYSSNNSAVAVPEPIVEAMPTETFPNYAFEDGGLYGYVSEVSEEDRAKGRATGDLSLFAYRGSSRGVHRLTMYDDEMAKVGDYECHDPCQVIRRMEGSSTLRRIPYDPRSILGGAFEDAIRGRLQVHLSEGRRRGAQTSGANVAAPSEQPANGPTVETTPPSNTSPVGEPTPAPESH